MAGIANGPTCDNASTDWYRDRESFSNACLSRKCRLPHTDDGIRRLCSDIGVVARQEVQPLTEPLTFVTRFVASIVLPEELHRL